MQQNIASIKYARIQFCIYSSLFNFVHRLFLAFITQVQLTDFWISVNSPATFVFSDMCLLRGKKKFYISKGTSKQHPFLQCSHYNKLAFFSSFVSLLFRKCVLKTDILVIPSPPTHVDKKPCQELSRVMAALLLQEDKSKNVNCYLNNE